jgi:glycosyltransferase involved in cell wall biosynthesis
MKILVLTRYGRLGASSRLRMFQYLPWLKQAGFDCQVQPFLNDEMLQTRYKTGRYGRSGLIHAYVVRVWQLMQRSRFDLVWIEKEALPWLPAWFERTLLRGVPYVLDYDDAVFHNYDLHPSVWVRRLFGRRLDRLMAGARLVVGGNDYLALRACKAGAPWVEVVPTVIDLVRYAAKVHSNHQVGIPRIVWIGSPSTVKYLAELQPALTSLAQRFQFTLRVVGAKLDMPGVDVECVPWTEDTEVASIFQCDVGIMPLSDSPWERGKCGYKLIQYMACGLPVVASPIGVNTQIVRDGQNGFLAEGSDAWVAQLAQLLSDPILRETMGMAGRQDVEEKYCVQQLAPRVASLLQKAAGFAL